MIAAAETLPAESLITDSPPIWPAAVRAALVHVEQAAADAVGRVENGRVILAIGFATFWDCCTALVHSLAARPAPAKYSAACAVADGLAEHLVKVFQDKDEWGIPRMAPLAKTPPTATVVSLLDTLRGRLAAADERRPPRESVEQIMRLPNVSDDFLLRMFPHLTIAQVWAFRADPIRNKLPDAPPESTAPPITTISPQLRKLLGQLDSVSDAAAAAEIEEQAEPVKIVKRCPETPRDLWQQKVPIAQSAKMLGMSMPDVAELFAKFDADYESDLLTGKIVTPVAQACRQLHAAGKPIKVIADELKIEASVVVAAITTQLQPA